MKDALAIALLGITVGAATPAAAWPKRKPARMVALPLSRPLLAVEVVDKRQPVPGQPYQLRFRLRDILSKQLQPDVQEIRVTSILLEGAKSQVWAQSLGEGLYEASIPIQQPGEYYVYFESASKRWSLEQVPLVVLQATSP